MSNILIIGANRGLGLEFVKQYNNTNHNIIATTRNKDSSKELNEVNNIDVAELDLTSDASVNNFVTSIRSQKIDILIHNAGIFSDEQLKEDLDIDAWMNEMRINAVIPIILARKLKNNLKMGSDKKVVFISSQMGSIDDNYSGRFYFYRSSKSALNSAAKSLSIDWKEDGISVLILHPGWVKTEMGGNEAKYETTEAVTMMLDSLEKLPQDKTGIFIGEDGKEIPW